MIQLLAGRKAYIIMGMMVLNGLYTLVFGEPPTFDQPEPSVTNAQAIQQILTGLGIGGLRAGIAKGK